MNRCIEVCSYFWLETKSLGGEAAFEGVVFRAVRPHCEAVAPAFGPPPLTAAARPGAEGNVTLCICDLAARRHAVPGECKAERLEHCLEMVAPRELLEGYFRQGCHLLSPGWLAGWRIHLAQWGFDERTAREFFRESASRLVLLDTGTIPGIEQELREFALFVDLPMEIVPVGIEYFSSYVAKLLAKAEGSEKT